MPTLSLHPLRGNCVLFSDCIHLLSALGPVCARVPNYHFNCKIKPSPLVLRLQIRLCILYGRPKLCTYEA